MLHPENPIPAPILRRREINMVCFHGHYVAVIPSVIQNVGSLKGVHQNYVVYWQYTFTAV